MPEDPEYVDPEQGFGGSGSESVHMSGYFNWFLSEWAMILPLKTI
jgi:hypothetical protein